MAGVFAGVVAECARGAFQLARGRRQRGDDGAEAAAGFRDGVLAKLAVVAEIDRNDIFGIQHRGFGDGAEHQRLLVACSLRGTPEARDGDFVLGGFQQLLGDEHLTAADIPLRRHTGAMIELAKPRR